MNSITPISPPAGSNAPLPPSPLSTAQIEAYLDYALALLAERRDSLTAVLQATAATIAVIDDDETLGDVAENMRMATALLRTSKEKFTEHKAPFLEGGRVVDRWFKAFNAPLSGPMAAVQAIMDGYGKRKEDAARKIAEAEARRLQDAADRATAAAAKALQKGKGADALLERAAVAQKAADDADAMADGRAADLTRVRGTFGATASMRTTWDYEVTDLNAVPMQFLMINDAAVKAAMKARDSRNRPTAVIPGVEWKAASSMKAR
jgi:hypothetical protein